MHAIYLLDDLQKMQISTNHNSSLLSDFILNKQLDQVETVRRAAKLSTIFLDVIDTSIFRYLPTSYTINPLQVIADIRHTLVNINAKLTIHNDPLTYHIASL